MSKYRKGKINDAVAQELCIALRDMTDPRIANALVSVTRAEVSADLKTAKIYFSCMGDVRETSKALSGAVGALRHALAQTLNLRITPELTFCHDESMEHGARIAQLLEQIKSDKTGEDKDDV